MSRRIYLPSSEKLQRDTNYPGAVESESHIRNKLRVFSRDTSIIYWDQHGVGGWIQNTYDSALDKSRGISSMCRYTQVVETWKQDNLKICVCFIGSIPGHIANVTLCLPPKRVKMLVLAVVLVCLPSPKGRQVVRSLAKHDLQHSARTSRYHISTLSQHQRHCSFEFKSILSL